MVPLANWKNCHVYLRSIFDGNEKQENEMKARDTEADGRKVIRRGNVSSRMKKRKRTRREKESRICPTTQYEQLVFFFFLLSVVMPEQDLFLLGLHTTLDNRSTYVLTTFFSVDLSISVDSPSVELETLACRMGIECRRLHRLQRRH